MRTNKIALETITGEDPIMYIHYKNNEKLSVLRIRRFLNVGRSHENELQLHDETVSKIHARISWERGSYYITDLNSQNGVFVNHNKVMKAEIKESDIIQLGKSELKLSSSPSSASQINALESKNKKWSEKINQLKHFSITNFPVLISGESGTGKEIIARSIHDISSRKFGPFITVNCSTFSSNLIESELFGHKKGSFTDATNDRVGAFEMARNGTLVLDEIGDMPLELQPKLLRALENKEIRPIGADSTLKTDVRIIASTHKCLVELVDQGLFREDLYFRLNVIQFEIPALRERMEDFETLLLKFAQEFKVHFKFETIQKLKDYNWPGNIRELKNFVKRTKAYFPNKKIDIDDIAKLNYRKAQEKDQNSNPKHFKSMEIEILKNAIMENGGNVCKAARSLNIPRSTLYDKVKKYNIKK